MAESRAGWQNVQPHESSPFSVAHIRGLVFGVFFAPRVERAPKADTPAAIPQVLINRDATRLDHGAIAQVVEGFLVDAQGTERKVVTRVSLARGERAGE
ncbi:MAG: hypothetical protein ACI8QS_001486 [Planctomycetota bacterium]|jgi:hypothetical protein